MLSENNHKKIDLVKELVARNLKKLLHEGYFGEATFQIKIQDGAIQNVKESSTEEHKI